jgi:putative ABC transport system permease protein
LFATIGPNTIFIQRFGVTDFANGAEIRDLLKRPNLVVSDARAIEQQATTLQYVDLELGAGNGPREQERVFYKNQKTRPVLVLGTSEFFAEGTRIPFKVGRFFNGTELQYRKNVVVLAYGPYQRLFEESGIDPIGKTVRIGAHRFEVVGAFDKRPTPGGFNVNADDFVVIPHTTYQRTYGMRVARIGNLGTLSNIQISLLPREGVSAEEAMKEVQGIMRARHGLKLDQPDDFDMFTQDSILKLYERISQAVLFSLVVISSIALMVGGIGVMAIMSISVTERTREIGVRKALGATTSNIQRQFFLEGFFLTMLSGGSGMLLAIGLCALINLAPMPGRFAGMLLSWNMALTSLALLVLVGVVTSTYPARRAAELPPVEALRFEM